MKFLLDTQVMLWMLQDAKSLGKLARERLVGADALYVSAASVWEAQSKVELPAGFVAAMADSGLSELPVTWAAVERAAEVKLPDGDKFDRLLIAQALVEQLVLVTADEVWLKAYPGLCVDARA